MRGKTTKLGNNVTMSCSANAGEDTSVTWFKNGAEFTVPIVSSQEEENNARIHVKRHQGNCLNFNMEIIDKAAIYSTPHSSYM